MTIEEAHKREVDIESGAIISLVLEFNQQTGELRLTGPITNKLLSFGLLEMAKDIVRKQSDQLAREPSRLIKPVLGGKIKV